MVGLTSYNGECLLNCAMFLEIQVLPCAIVFHFRVSTVIRHADAVCAHFRKIDFSTDVEITDRHRTRQCHIAHLLDLRQPTEHALSL